MVCIAFSHNVLEHFFSSKRGSCKFKMSDFFSLFLLQNPAKRTKDLTLILHWSLMIMMSMQLEKRSKVLRVYSSISFLRLRSFLREKVVAHVLSQACSLFSMVYESAYFKISVRKFKYTFQILSITQEFFKSPYYHPLTPIQGPVGQSKSWSNEKKLPTKVVRYVSVMKRNHHHHPAD